MYNQQQALYQAIFEQLFFSLQPSFQHILSKKYCIAGFGKTGQSVARFLSSENLEFIVYDSRENISLPNSFSKRVNTKCFFGNVPTKSALEDIDICVLSPGLALDSEIALQMKQCGIPIVNDISLFAEAFERSTVEAKIVALTASNGKSTVAGWLEHVLNENGVLAVATGNFGPPLLDCWLEKPLTKVWILELSSFQLEVVANLPAHIGTVLNVSPDHTDRHPDFNQYIQTKQKLFSLVETALINRDDNKSYPLARKNSVSYGLNAPSRSIDYGVSRGLLVRGSKALVALDRLALQGEHNQLNLMAVWSFSERLGLRDDVIKNAAIAWEGLQHRFQRVKTQDGKNWINDSKATNSGALEAALKSCIKAITPGKKLWLIAGGQTKGCSFLSTRRLLSQLVSCVFLIGEDGSKLKKQWTNTTEIELSGSLESAIVSAGQRSSKGDTILFAPGCASFDMFDNFEHRGRVFAALVSQVNQKSGR